MHREDEWETWNPKLFINGQSIRFSACFFPTSSGRSLFPVNLASGSLPAFLVHSFSMFLEGMKDMCIEACVCLDGSLPCVYTHVAYTILPLSLRTQIRSDTSSYFQHVIVKKGVWVIFYKFNLKLNIYAGRYRSISLATWGFSILLRHNAVVNTVNGLFLQ